MEHPRLSFLFRVAFAPGPNLSSLLVCTFLGLFPFVNADLFFFPVLFFGQGPGHLLVLSRRTTHQHQEVLFRFGAVRIVHQESAAEPDLHGGCGEHVRLGGVFRIELEDGSASAHQALVKGSEEGGDPLPGILFAGFCVAEPLDGADGHGTVEGAGSEGQSVS